MNRKIISKLKSTEARAFSHRRGNTFKALLKLLTNPTDLLHHLIASKPLTHYPLEIHHPLEHLHRLPIVSFSLYLEGSVLDVDVEGFLLDVLA